MKTRATLALAAVAGLSAMAQAQEVINVSYSFIEVLAGTTTPAATQNGQIDPGEGARIRVDLNYTINGANGVGQTTTFNPPPPPGFGTALGWGSFYVDLVGTGGDASGTWSSRTTGSGFNFGNQTGNILNSGATVQGWGAGQSVIPGFEHTGPNTYVPHTPLATNPVNSAVRGVWTPASYANRTIHWAAIAGTNVPAGQAMAILLGIASTSTTQNDGGEDNGGIDTQDTTFSYYSTFFAKYPNINFGSGLDITVAPAPSSLALLGLGGLVAGRRRRTR